MKQTHAETLSHGVHEADACCAVCAAAHSHTESGHEHAENEKHIHFGGYALPLKRVIHFAIALGLWLIGLVLMHLNSGAEGIFWDKPESGAGWGPLRLSALIFLVAAYILAGLPVLRSALSNLRQGHALDENFLMSIASIGAFAVGEWEEAVGVMIFYMIGEMIQEAAVLRSRSSIDALLALKPDMARVKTEDRWTEVSADGVSPGTELLVRPGERIPLDGIVLEGAGSVDASMLSGESRPVPVNPGDEVRSGTVSLDGVLVIKATKTADNSSAAKIIELVESAKEAKAKPERFITAFAKWYTPLVVGAAVLLAIVPPLVLPGAQFSVWLYRSLILLVISCPCALVVSVPLGYFAGIGGMSRRGIMVKGAVHLDSLGSTKYVAFDKTGTLTQGKFSIVAMERASGIDENQLLETAVLAEQESNHPIAQAIRRGGKERGISGAAASAGTARYREIAGQGLELRFEESEETILAGNQYLLESKGIALSGDGPGRGMEDHTAVYIARNGRYYGRILVGDTIKEGAAEAVRQLSAQGVTQTVMFTGDAEGPAHSVASQLGITAVEAGLLPEDKLREVEKLTRQGITVFVGDGINDAPVLARSDVGIAMGSGADAAVEAADVIIMTDDPRRVPEAIERARKTRRIVMGNVIFALTAKGIFISLAILGLANMWIALIADVGVALVAILNATRALR
ncbi:MAG: heavy metal translocating P-type ATPase [Treponema sp.]|jgi:Cd2+/Zn2+-exporting ATPase|nr:heavy metal translocating P-type ATPase [Treponema sp.]